MSVALPFRPPLPLRIRPARLEEAPALAALQRRAARELRARGAHALATWLQHVGRLDLEAIEDGTYRVAVASGVLAGCGGWSAHGALAGIAAGADPLEEAREPAWILTLFVEPCFARRGVGAALLRAVERAAAREGFRSSTLDATPSGEPLARRAGYRAVGPLAVALPGGVRVSVLRMEKSLAPAPL